MRLLLARETLPTVVISWILRASKPSLDTDQACNLSARECECLEWAAKGKISWETSKIMGVTESTIIYHLRNATRKLIAANRLHAVTKALKAF